MRALLAALLLAASAARAGAPETAFQEVVVRPGDTLWGISQKYLKDPARWDEILKHNRLPTRDPTVALPGLTLKVPIRLIKAQLRAAHLVYAVNRVLFRRRDTAQWNPAKMRLELFQGDSLRTLADSKARVKFLDRELLSLEPNSMAIIKPVDGDADVVLRSGSVFAGRARVVTASARVTPRTSDTRYAATVAPDLTTKVEVYKGLAAVDAQGSTIEVPAGMATQVRAGLAPEVPKKIEEWPELEARAMEYASASSVGGGAAPAPRAAAPMPVPEADAASLRGDLNSLRVGVPILGYRVQAARDQDFKEKVFDKKYESEERFEPSASGVPPGAYWWRVAVIDLLGEEGRFSEPRYFTLGVKRSAAAAGAIDLKRALSIVTPVEDAVIYADTTRVIGVLRDDRLRVAVNGQPARADADGNFVAVVPLKPGANEILVTVTDARGNSTSVSRRVRRP